MLIVGVEYRVYSLKEGTTSWEGKVLQSDGPMFVLDVDGAQIVFHMAAVARAEVIDREAEEARAKASRDAWAASIG